MVKKVVSKKKSVSDKNVEAKQVKKVGKKSFIQSHINLINIISIVFGGISILILLFLPNFSGIISGIGLILAYSEKGKGSQKLNHWAFVLNIVSILLSLILLYLLFIVAYGVAGI